MKEQLIELASSKVFYASSFQVRCLVNPDTYFLWMCELKKILIDEYDCAVTPIIIGGLTPKNGWYDYKIYHKNSKDLKRRCKKPFFAYEQALEAGLIEALKLI